MFKIGSGTAFDEDPDDQRDFWVIKAPAGDRLAKFFHPQFEAIETGTPVYYIDLDVDKLCENVQPQLDVDRLVARASPDKGIVADAEVALRAYIMAALLAMLAKPQNSRPEYFRALKGKMDAVQSRAEDEDCAVTVILLTAMGIPAAA